MIFELLKYLALIIIFGIIFSFLPKYIYSWINKLLTFKEYGADPIKNRTKDVVVLYLILGLVFGLVFMVIFSLGNIAGINLEKDSTEFLSKSNILLSFFTSFSLVFILRITTLLSKSNLLKKMKFLPDKYAGRIITKNKSYDYEKLKCEMVSFLFSILLTTILALLVFVSYNILFNPTNFVHFPEGASFESIGMAIFIILLFSVILCVITYLGELILTKVGSRPMK